MLMDNRVIIYRDLFTSKNLDWCEKLVLTQIRFGCERFGDYNFNYKVTAEYFDFLYSWEQLKFTTEKLIAVGLVDAEEVEVVPEGYPPFKTQRLKVNENKLKKIL